MKAVLEKCLQRCIREAERWFGVHIYRVRRRSLGLGMPEYIKLPEHIEIRQASERELWAATSNPDVHISADFLREALARGDKAYAAFDDGQIVAYTWRTGETAPHDGGLRVQVSPPFVYGYKGFSLPSHRGMRLNIAVNEAASAHYRELGYTHSAGFVALYNQSKLVNEREHGYEFLGYAGYLRWFGRIIPFRTHGAKQAGFGFFQPQ